MTTIAPSHNILAPHNKSLFTLPIYSSVIPSFFFFIKRLYYLGFDSTIPFEFPTFPWLTTVRPLKTQLKYYILKMFPNFLNY